MDCGWPFYGSPKSLQDDVDLCECFHRFDRQLLQPVNSIPWLFSRLNIPYGRPVLSRKPWEIEAVLGLLMGLFLIFGMGGIAASALGSMRSSPKPKTIPAAESTPSRMVPVVTPSTGSFAAFVVATVTFHGAVLLLVVHFVRQHKMGVAEAFGWRTENVARAVGSGVTLAGVALPLAYGLQWISIVLLRYLGRPWGYEPSVQSSVEILLHTANWVESAYIFVFATMIAPVAEELLFRGILYPFARDRGFPRLALWGTALVFGAMHGNLAAFLPLVCFGALLAGLYEKTGNLVAPITAHALFNLIPFVFLACGLEPSH